MIVNFEVFDETDEDDSARISVGEKSVLFSVGNHGHIEDTHIVVITYEEAKRCLEHALVLINKRIKENGKEERV